MVNPFTKKDDESLVKYIAVNNPRRKGRLGTNLYQQLVENKEKWPWAERHSWLSWLAYYKSKQEFFDHRIRNYQDKHNIPRSPSSSTSMHGRRSYTAEEDTNLIAFLAEMAPLKRNAKPRAKLGRSGNYIYQNILVANPDKYPWALRHSWQSWRARYIANQQAFDKRIEQWQEKHGIDPERRAHQVDKTHARGKVVVSDVEMDCEEDELDESQYDSSSEYDRKRRREDNDENDAECLSQPQKKQKVSGTQSPAPSQSANQTSRSPVEFNPTSETVPDTSSLHPPLPTQHHIPGTYPESPRSVDATSRHAPSESASVGRSHPPTTPPTNVHSDASVPSPTLVSGPPGQSTKANGNEHAVSPVVNPASMSTVHTSHSPYQDCSRGGMVGANLPRPIVTRSPRKLEQHPKSQFTPSTPLFDPSSPMSSDDPFATSSPTPRRTEVIRGIPKPRPGRSFRDNDRVRPRNVLLGAGGHSGNVQQTLDYEDKDEEERWPPTKNKGNSKVSERRPSPQLSSPALTHDALITGNVTRISTHQHPKQAIASNRGTQHRPHSVRNDASKAPNSSPSSISDSKVIHRYGVVQKPNLATSPDNVFASRTPMASGDPYVLGTAHLPESSTDSSISRTRPGSPVPRRRNPPDRHRRRTFASFDLRSGLPDVDLVAKLGKRGPSRSPVFKWSRGSPDFPMKNIQSASSRRPLLTASEHRAASRGPPRKSVIPILADADDQDTVPLSLDQLSPSTSGLIIKMGLSTIFKQMEMNHGFSTDVVERAWRKQNMDLNATDKMLLRMRIAAENALQSDQQEVFAHGAPPVVEKHPNQTLVERVESKNVGRHSTPTAVHPAQYRPPPHSGADQYLRLSEQGRIREARRREIELANVASVDNSLVNVASSKQSTIPVSQWGDHHDAALQTGDGTIILGLAQKFGEDVVRRKFLTVMRQSHK